VCRSAIEYPPYGKRCGKGDHLSPEDKEARRLARNAREKELYYIRKARKAEEAVTVKLSEVKENLPTTNPVQLSSVATEVLTVKKEALRVIATDENRLTAGFKDSAQAERVFLEDEKDRLAVLLGSEQGDLAYMPVKEEDTAFNEGNFSTNEVRRLILEDGSVAYFKSYEGAYDWDEDGTTLDYGHTYLATSLNEVAAYRLAEALGEGYTSLVPETVMTEYKGRLGTLQRESKGEPGPSFFSDLKEKYEHGELDANSWRKAAILDAIAGSQDRHCYNYLIEEVDGVQKITLIDNGYSFARWESYYNETDVLNYVTRITEETDLTTEERATIQKLMDDPTFGGLTALLSEDSVNCCRERAQKMLDSGIYQINAGADWFEDGWDKGV
jgi:hypothetical protein